MDRFFRFIEKHPISVIVIILVITAFMAFQMAGIKLNGSYTAFIPWDENSDEFIGGQDGQKIITGTEDGFFDRFFSSKNENSSD